MNRSMPEQIGHYRVTAKLGEGGMGLVYEAVDDRLGRPIALKIIRHDAVGNTVARERFWREARLAASVNHPNICQLYEIGEADGVLFIAMERLDGESLASRLSRGALSLADTVQIGLEVLAALDALHHRGIVHRDLKPSNIFLTPHGVKVLDFGLAQPVEDDLGETRMQLTVPGMMLGTPKYMAPEQILGGATDARTDLFATGALLYEMLAGYAPFAGNSLPAVSERILHADPAVLGGSPGVAAADRVIHRALAKSPDRRYPSAAAMAADLRTVLIVRDDEPRRARAVTRLIVLPFRLLRPDAEIDFLAFSLADAITNSLSPIESLVVRSSLAAARFAADVPDLKAIASEAGVDVALSGTLLRAGEQLRVSVQLVEAPGGDLIWSHTSQVPIGDIFQLQDDLARRIVESLALPLSGRERRALGRDVPSSAKAYEFYLRANQLSQDSSSWDVARDLYLQCVEADPQYAPAWAWLGRVHRVIGKFRGDQESLARAESALNRALQLNPDLSIADRFYAQIEVDAGRGQEAMVRLIRRASSRSSDQELFTALVSVCRYCGLLQASLAAHERARRLDPHMRTSVQHTFVMMGDYLRAAAEPAGAVSVGGLALAMAGHTDAIRQCKADLASARAANIMTLASLLEAILAMLEGNGNAAVLRSAVEGVIAGGLRDPEGWFYMALELAHFGGESGADRAVELLASVVERGFFPYGTFLRHGWLEPLRHRPDFTAILQKAERRHHEALAAFVEAGGESLLGVGA